MNANPDAADDGGSAPDAPEPAGEENAAAAVDAGPLRPRRPDPDTLPRLAAIRRALEGAERVLVLTHDNPDPDAIASAAGLGLLVERVAGLPVTLAFGGIIGRAENRALMEELGQPFERIENVNLTPSTAVALVDTQPRAGNNSLPAGRIASVVVDHHPVRPESASATFADVRPEYGACASMVVEFLRAARIEPDRRLATALFYGIQSETMDLGRETSQAEVDASIYLYPRSDPGAISRIRHARVPRGLYRAIHEGLERAWSRGSVVCVPAGRLDYPDIVAQLADLFLRVQGVEWVIAAGRYGSDVLLSLRTYEQGAHAGDVVRAVVGERGSAGGHGEMAGARLSAGHLRPAEVEDLVASLFEDVCVALGVEEEPREPLIATAGKRPE
ncbi:MAG: DHH family phosphoesterase [Gemmatimonadota bacterium]|nr:DHH family phosphoesterase [Gemmatimonadota bacterium]